jgi:hypothetical protein
MDEMQIRLAKPSAASPSPRHRLWLWLPSVLSFFYVTGFPRDVKTTLPSLGEGLGVRAKVKGLFKPDLR